MRVLLTGANGFLGTTLIRAGLGLDLVVLGRSRPAGFEGEWIKGDLADTLPVARLPNQVDAVIHLAQSNQYRSFPAGAADMFAVNVASTARLLDWAVKARARSFIFASTGNVYGARAGLSAETDAPVVQGQFYGASKLAAEALVAGYGGLMATCSLRLFCLYGPHQPSDKLVGNLIQRVMSGQPITVQGQGEGNITQPTYAADVAAVIRRALAEGWSGTVNVAGAESASIQRLGELIGKALGRSPIFQRVDGEPPPPLLPNLDRLRQIGALPFTSLAEGIARTVAAVDVG